MFQKVLTCADGSACALAAARVGAAIARHFGGEIVALNVYQDALSALGAWALEIDPVAIERNAHRTKLSVERGIGPLFAEVDAPHRFLQERGHPVEAILRVAEREKAGLIVLGSRGLQGVEALMLGSVSSGILHHATCPVLIVRGELLPTGTAEFQHILLASDGSERANRAALVAVAMAQKFATSLTVLNACADISSVTLPG